MSAQEFLNLYKELEEDLDRYFEAKGRRSQSPIYDYMNSKEGQVYKETLDVCREIRNLLSHHADVDGQSVVEPAAGLLEDLKEVINYVNHPPLAIDASTMVDRLLITDETRNVYDLMQIMDKRGFSHIPVVKSGRVTGVFSVSTIFAWQLANPEETLDMTKTVGDLVPYLSFSKHRIEQFGFAGRDLTVLEAREALEKKQRGKRVSAIFLTDNGEESGKLLAMVTPYDVIG
ncbi:MAG: CBS domain-containing protein [Lachnospiraceae bacterium]|nr:CBS domain-containing protein [Lachnospiraceae bacterium]